MFLTSFAALNMSSIKNAYNLTNYELDNFSTRINFI